VEITDFGVFVNLGGIDGLVHRSELTHGRFNHPRDVVKVGDKVKVEVLDMDLERERINLSMKSLLPNPWENVLTNYVIGQRVSGKVTNLTPFGAFVEIEPGLEGLIHVSEMSWTKRVRHPKEIVTEGDEVETMILKIDTQQQRISLGLRQTQPDPWSSLPDRYPPGTEVTGPITGITDFGVFMEIEEGIEGLVHISELAHEHIEDVNEHFKRGDEVTAVILNIDPVEQRASLSRKRLLPFTAGPAATTSTARADPRPAAPAARPADGPRRGAAAVAARASTTTTATRRPKPVAARRRPSSATSTPTSSRSSA
jgi:small subunit ribosomal protein S1